MRIPDTFLPTVCFCAVLLTVSCKDKQKDAAGDPLFTLLDSTGINFQNSVVDTKVDNSFLFRNFYNGGGVSIGDLNNDGLCDVVLTSNMGENKLFLNKGGLKFEDITSRSGMRQEGMWSTGAALVDINNDGWLDMYVCNSGHINDGNRRNKLYINNRDLSFTEASKEYGLDHSGFCTQSSFFDYDMDGDLDCFLINNSPLPFSSLNYAGMRDTEISKWNVADNLKGGGNHLFRNDPNPGTGKPFFTEVTKEAGLHTGLISFGLGISVGDINNDDYPDVYVGNDFIEKDYLYINQRDGTFKDELESRIQQISMSSMSSDLGDINNDGYPEIFTTDMIPDDDFRLKTTGTFDNIDLYLSKQKAGLYHQYVKNALQLNNKNGTFSEIANFSGIAGTDWSWGSIFLDADNDGLNDIFVCNGINKDVGNLDFLDFFSNDVYMKMQETGKREEIDEILRHIPATPLANRVFRNSGDLRFEDIGRQWGLDAPGFSNSVAYGDLDNDGDLDLVINNENQPASVYRNNARQQTANNFIGVVIQGSPKNTHGIGTRIKVYNDSSVFTREVSPSRGFQASVDYKQIIGLGALSNVDSMVIVWPNRTSTSYASPAINKVHVLKQSSDARQPFASHPTLPTHLTEIASTLESHLEDEYVDFYYERNLPELLSTEGPRIAQADVNGDGLEDIYIGGAKGQAGQLYLQTKTGFEKKEQLTFKIFSDFEDVAALFFDSDGDGDQDLYLGAGGNNVPPDTRTLQHRLYKNDGNGNFQIDTKAFPNNNMNISVAAANDFDVDGDMDLFIGSRSIPFNYGGIPQSYLYQNDGNGHFTDVAGSLNETISHIGMVTGAVWADVSGDAKKELIITGQWMATRIFGYNKAEKSFDELLGTGLEKMFGWWQTIEAGDLNGDGKADLVIGNIGQNFYLRPSQQSPAKLWIHDFDQNGVPEQFLTRTISGRDMPVLLKREITDQFPGLKKSNLKHSEYAVKSIQELFGDETISKSTNRLFDYCASIIAINKGDGKFVVDPLPVEIQLSSVNAILLSDVNRDGKLDLVVGGNLFGFPPQFGRLDASYGHVLINQGNGKFLALDPSRSGLSLTGMIKDIAEIRNGTNRLLIVARNGQKPGLYKVN
ncbi:MAG: VCBS repeat-containing protein [Chitinophagaceae bacterium]|nr:VCBS repeat-containing protein [Chitinophagaceae bacterium]